MVARQSGPMKTNHAFRLYTNFARVWSKKGRRVVRISLGFLSFLFRNFGRSWGVWRNASKAMGILSAWKFVWDRRVFKSYTAWRESHRHSRWIQSGTTNLAKMYSHSSLAHFRMRERESNLCFFQFLARIPGKSGSANRIFVIFDLWFVNSRLKVTPLF